jgi:hypothetical protein
MGGETGVTSKPGCGSTFWFGARLEIDNAVAGQQESTLSEPERKLRQQHQGTRILLVEDDPMNQEIACELLKKPVCR